MSLNYQSTVEVNGRRIHSIHFADDIVLMADLEKDINNVLGIFNKILKMYKLRINTKKT